MGLVATTIADLRQRVQIEQGPFAGYGPQKSVLAMLRHERVWAIVSAHQTGTIRRIASATGLSSSRIHQLLNAPETKEIPVWVSELRQ
jgi:hypothetical protein